MANKDKLKLLLDKLSELENSLPGGEVLGMADRIIDEKYKEITSKVKEDSSIKMLGEISGKINRFKRDFNLKPILKQLDDFQALFDQMHESIVSQFEETSQSSENTRNELESLIKSSSENLTKMTAKELKAVLQRLDSLENQFSFESEGSKNDKKSLKEVIDGLESKLTSLVDDFKKSSTESQGNRADIESRLKERGESITKLQEELETLRKDTMSKIAGLGGGSMNRQINVNSSVMSSKYTDINFQQGGNIGWSVSDDDTNKRVNIRASILAGGGGAGTPGGNNTEIQFNDGGSFGGASVLGWDKNASILSLGSGSARKFQILARGGTNDQVLHLWNSSVTSTFIFQVTGPASSDTNTGKAFAFIVEGDANARGAFYTDGKYGMGPGSATRDVFFSRPAGGTFRISSDAVLGGANLHVTSSIATGVQGSVTGALVFNGRTSQNVKIQPASIAGNWTLTLPSVAGSTGQYLQTDGNGTTQWASVASGGVSRTVSVLSVSSTLAASAGVDYVFFPNVGINLTLPTAISNTNRYSIKNMSASSILVSAATGQNIDGNTDIVLSTQYAAVDLMSNNSVWGIF